MKKSIGSQKQYQETMGRILSKVNTLKLENDHGEGRSPQNTSTLTSHDDHIPKETLAELSRLSRLSKWLNPTSPMSHNAST